MKTKSLLFCLLLVGILSNCSLTKDQAIDNGKIEIQILQVNDVYEIAPLASGTEGGMARVAQLRKELLQKNENTLTVLAGDFLNPSVIGTLKYKNDQGKMERIRGKQMIDAMNAAGVDLVTFGNHEFDLKYADLQKRLDESQFEWIAGNVKHQLENGSIKDFSRTNQNPFPKHIIKEFKDKDGTTFKLGILSVCITVNQPKYVHFDDVIETAKASYETLKAQTDAVIALTHLSIEEDKVLATHLPGVPLIMGGHEHHHMKVPVGETIITKADANAKSAYIHQLRFDHKTKKLFVKSTLKDLDESVALEPTTNAVVEKWVAIADASFKAKGINPNAVVKELTAPIDARKSNI